MNWKTDQSKIAFGILSVIPYFLQIILFILVVGKYTGVYRFPDLKANAFYFTGQAFTIFGAGYAAAHILKVDRIGFLGLLERISVVLALGLFGCVYLLLTLRMETTLIISILGMLIPLGLPIYEWLFHKLIKGGLAKRSVKK